MYIAKVIGDVVSSIKYPTLTGQKILVIQPIDPDGSERGEPLLAMDQVSAGIGDVVLIVDQGSATRQVLKQQYPTIRTLILGIVDRIDMPEGDPR
ncbi:MAG: EutN/CcmL family microcompartment protein [bacterium]|jgi:ethanolamine utilization protein EutN